MNTTNESKTTNRDALADDMWKRIMGDPALEATRKKLSIDNLRTIIIHAVDAATVHLDAAEARYQSAVKGRKEFRQAYRERRITENYNDSRETTHLNFAKDTETGDWIFSGRVLDSDLVRLELDRVDRAVITSPAETSADVLQILEIIFRRLGEQNAKAA